jgi:hypothetical protein
MVWQTFHQRSLVRRRDGVGEKIQARSIQRVGSAKAELGLTPSAEGLPAPMPTGNQLVPVTADVNLPLPLLTGQQLVPLTADLDGIDVTVWIPPQGRRAFRQRFTEFARRENAKLQKLAMLRTHRRSSPAGVGGAIAASGVIALATASGPLALAAVAATVVGSLTAAVGLLLGHLMNKKKFVHEERMDRYLEAVEELK